ncbi:hypothetical protein CLU83_1946 [Flavobacterium sp. 1]|uniref:DUF5977 domain-containing protein n=1 Tax=Flavobacterium sp. 1 TaxID=2035200 RepID=UPI000C235C4D|nr:DUF5977 domain-containing protein [Flavobacterium sp. 1]PJJ08660.1 hypothetical protein CLU83_1946 [Flavobacterium sp. 1]
MDGNTEYRPFALLEQYTPDEGATEYYNTLRTLTAVKNDCSDGTVGSSVTLTANANHFVSTESVADANTQADSWLAANGQAYANNLGTCNIRTTAWRGINPSCVIEPTTALSPFDYMVIRYKWTLGAGEDLDTYTGIVNTGTPLDNKWMGWQHGFGNELPELAEAANSYIMWAGDNQGLNGIESCLVNFSKITSDYPALNTVQVRMAGSWFKPVATGNIDVEITTYLGGTMDKSGFDILNTGGIQVQQLSFTKNVPIEGENLNNNIELVTSIGYITYTKSDATGQIVITY